MNISCSPRLRIVSHPKIVQLPGFVVWYPKAEKHRVNPMTCGDLLCKRTQSKHHSRRAHPKAIQMYAAWSVVCVMYVLGKTDQCSGRSNGNVIDRADQCLCRTHKLLRISLYNIVQCRCICANLFHSFSSPSL